MDTRPRLDAGPSLVAAWFRNWVWRYATRPGGSVVALRRDLVVDLVCAAHSVVHRVPVT
jgi:hypothetical protein